MKIEEYIKDFKRVGFRTISCPKCNGQFTDMTKFRKHYKGCEGHSVSLDNLEQINDLEKLFKVRIFHKWKLIVLDKWISAFREEVEEAYREDCDQASDVCEQPFIREELD